MVDGFLNALLAASRGVLAVVIDPVAERECAIEMMLARVDRRVQSRAPGCVR